MFYPHILFFPFLCLTFFWPFLGDNCEFFPPLPPGAGEMLEEDDMELELEERRIGSVAEGKETAVYIYICIHLRQQYMYIYVCIYVYVYTCMDVCVFVYIRV